MPTFTRPPLTTFSPTGHYYTLPALYDFHYTHSPNHPLFVFPDPETESGRRVITWREGLLAAQRATEYGAAAIHKTPASGSKLKQPVFAVLSAGDTLPYFIFILGVLRISTNYNLNSPPPAVFPISPKLPADVVAHLLLKTHATHLVLSGDEGTQSLGRAAADILIAKESSADGESQGRESAKIEILAMPTFTQLFPVPTGSSSPKDADIVFKYCPPIHTSSLSTEEIQAYLDAPSLILHSTGTTGTPKPIPWTARHLAQGIRVPCSPLHVEGDEDLVGKVIGCQAVPMFAAMGSINLFAAPTRGAALAFFAPTPDSPSAAVAAAPAPNPVNLMNAAVESGCDFLLCVPAFLEIWARDPGTVDVMKRMRGFVRCLLLWTIRASSILIY